MDRPGNKLRVTIRTSRPGIIIGRKGAEIEKLKQDLAKRTKREVFIDIQEVHKPELDAQLVSESIALQLEKRVAFRRAMRKAVDSALRFGCKGIKVRVSGRLNGAEIARSEWYLQGQLPLHTLRADIDYGFAEAHTTYGVIGVKAWVYKGEILDLTKRRAAAARAGAAPRAARPARPRRSRRPRIATGDRRRAAPQRRSRCRRSRAGPRRRRRPSDLPRPARVRRPDAAAADVAAAAVLEAGSAARGAAAEHSRNPLRKPKPRRVRTRSNRHVDAEEGQVPKAAARPHDRQGLARLHDRFRRLRPEGAWSAAGSPTGRSKPPASP